MGNESDIPVYPFWDEVPAHLRTEKALRHEGLTPHGPVRGRCVYEAFGTERVHDLYDVRETMLTPARQVVEQEGLTELDFRIRALIPPGFWPRLREDRWGLSYHIETPHKSPWSFARVRLVHADAVGVAIIVDRPGRALGTAHQQTAYRALPGAGPLRDVLNSLILLPLEVGAFLYPEIEVIGPVDGGPIPLQAIHYRRIFTFEIPIAGLMGYDVRYVVESPVAPGERSRVLLVRVTGWDGYIEEARV